MSEKLFILYYLSLFFSMLIVFSLFSAYIRYKYQILEIDKHKSIRKREKQGYFVIFLINILIGVFLFIYVLNTEEYSPILTGVFFVISIGCLIGINKGQRGLVKNE